MPGLFDITDPQHHAFIPEGTFLLAYRGSIAHNMYVPNSDPGSIDDIDLMGVVLGEARHYFGLHDWARRGTKEIKEGQYDCVFYEIRKMFNLLLQGNPNVMSLLWLRPEDYLVLSEPAQRILQNRSLFAGKHVYDAFAGYAQQQLSKMETRDPAELRTYLALTYEAKSRGIHPNHKGLRMDFPESYDHSSGDARNATAHSDAALLANIRTYMKKGENLGYLGDKRKNLVLEHGYDAKNAAHCIRLLRMASEYLRTGELTVFRPDAAELLEIKRGKWELSRVKAHADELFVRMSEAREASPLPDGPDFERAESLLVALLSDHVRRS
jgi:predicted nucleotidyltransferase